MHFKIPKFWHKVTRLSLALQPLSWLYLRLSRLRYLGVKPYKAAVPVVCIGNLVLGGAGKTPTAIAVVEMLKQLGYNPHILSRGYGAVIKDFIRVDLNYHDYLRVGDEPLLLAQVAPTWAGANRVASAEAAIKAGADVLVLDDGFQNRAICKDFNILAVDARQGFGNRFVFPAGPLREPVEEGLSRAHAVLLIGGEDIGAMPDPRDAMLPATSKPVFTACLRGVAGTSPCAVVAFAGLGYPQKFRQTLEEQKYEIKEFLTYPDHHPYTVMEMQRLIKIAEYYKARLITTAKDHLRVPHQFRSRVLVLPVELQFNDQAHFMRLLKKSLVKSKG